MTIIDDRKAALMARVKEYGGPLNEPAVLAQFLAQVMHESGGLRYVREIWGPTKAQRGYEGRKDLGNVNPGDGKRFMGRDVIQVTGRLNYWQLTVWVRDKFKTSVSFVEKPELLEGKEWLGTYQSATGVEFVVLGDTINQAARISDVARHGSIWASKSLIGKMGTKERDRITYGVRRRASDGRELFVESSFSFVSSLLEQDGVRLEKLRDIATLAITEVVAIKPGQ